MTRRESTVPAERRLEAAVSRAEITRREFTLQAEALSRSPTFTSEEVLEQVRTALGKHRGGRILDLACGPGIVSAGLAVDAAEVVGVDLTPEMLARARAHCDAAGHTNTSFREAPAEALPFEDGVFDAVVTRLAIHHFEDPGVALREAHRVLGPGGRLVVLDIVASADPREAELHNALESLRDPSHVRMLSESELVDVIRRAGFGTERFHTWSQSRSFDEWAAIVADARSVAALLPVMRSLASGGSTAGIGLEARDDTLMFQHNWLLVAANRSESPGSPAT
jgi:ubiquinone/menaquinone biosynthesis C-methylase UbiE